MQESHEDDKWEIKVDGQAIELTDDQLFTLIGLLNGAPAWMEMVGGWGINHHTIKEERRIQR